MPDREKVANGLEKCRKTLCEKCPYNYTVNDGKDDICGMNDMLNDALDLLKEQEAVIEQYHKADTFLAAHGWSWESR